MKALLAAPLALLLGVAVIPVVLGGGDAPPTTACPQLAGPIGVILATIRQMESGDDYRAQSPGSSASGAYQFLDSTWAGYGGYRRARDAPPAVQDAKAAAYARAILDEHGDDVSAVPVAWYLGHVPAPDSPEWDTVPAPGAGNRLTPRQYQAKWMALYGQLLGASPRDGGPTTVPSAPEVDETCPVAGVTPAGPSGPTVGGWAFPLPRDAVAADVLDEPHHDYPALDILVPVGTPVYALTAGTVVRLTDFAHNWWNDACPHPGCDPCGIGLSVEAAGGLRYIYCHGSEIGLHLGERVAAGQFVLATGDTGQSGAPHLHVELKVDSVRRCPQPLLRALYLGGTPPDPVTLPTTGCTFSSTA